MSHDAGRVCRCVVDHRPDPLELEVIVVAAATSIVVLALWVLIR